MSRNPRWQTRLFRKRPGGRGECQLSWSACKSRLARTARAAATGTAVAVTAALSIGTPGAAAAQPTRADHQPTRADHQPTQAEHHPTQVEQWHAPLAGPQARAFNGTKAVGALFVNQKGKLTHFCTASVVASPAGDLLLTAAHCLEGRSLTPAGSLVFAPEYHSGKFPLGTFEIRQAFTDSAWHRNRNPDDDFAFLIAGKPGQNVQKKTGAETLQTGTRLPRRVQVIGYPDATSRPITCSNTARAFTRHGLHQMVFDCPGYTDGTSGGPFLINVKATTGDGKVIGAIGGYQQGGNTSSVSYSARFLASIAALYKAATAP